MSAMPCKINNVFPVSALAIFLLSYCHHANALELNLKNAFGSLNAGYANWNSGFENVHRGEVWKLTADFGATFDKGEFYSFYENNVLNHDIEGQNYVLSAQTHIRLLSSNFSFMGKLYGQFDNQWSDDLDMLYGLGYLGWSGKSGYFKPYVAFHNESSDYKSQSLGGKSASGRNGYVVGWTTAYFFSLWKENFVLSDWHEIEFDRNDAYAEQQHGSNGINGGLTLTWKFYPHLKTSITWRYFDNKLGYDGFGDQMIYMLGYEF
jgi:hypothetical protein